MRQPEILDLFVVLDDQVFLFDVNVALGFAVLNGICFEIDDTFRMWEANQR